MRAAVLGAVNMDWIGTPDGVLTAEDSNPGRVVTRMGGVGRNIAEAMLRLGTEVSMVTALGDDSGSVLLRHFADELGLDLSLSRELPGEHCGTYLCINDQHGNVAAAIADMTICDRMTPAFFEPVLPLLSGYDIAVIDANLPAETLTYLSQKLPMPICADPVSAAKAVRLRGALPRLFAVKPNVPEAEVLTGLHIQSEADELQAAEQLHAAGTKHVFISLGERGALYVGEDGFCRLPCVPGNIRNTNGCGDTFLGAVCTAMIRGQSGPQAACYGLCAASVNAESDCAVHPDLCEERINERMKHMLK